MMKNYTKLGGWLIFFIVVQTIGCFVTVQEYAEVTNVFNIVKGSVDGVGTVHKIFSLATLLSIVISVLGIAGVLVKNKKMMVGYFAIAAIDVVVMSILYMFLDTEVFSAGARSGVLLTIIKNIVAIIIWIRVFMTSPRSKEYFKKIN